MNAEELEAKCEVISTAKRLIKDMGYKEALTHVLADHMSKLTALSDSSAAKELGKKDHDFAERIIESMLSGLMGMSVWAEIAGIDLMKADGGQEKAN